MTTTVAAAMSKQQARTDATRRRLLEAAERIFVRDGFEAARLEDIAAQAGYTRGALYANFEDKEDIFFGVLEQHVADRVAEVTELMRQHQTADDLRKALRVHYAQIAKKRNVALLSLEFKLYAIRHPEAHGRMRARQQKMRVCGMEILRRLTEDLGRELAVPAEAAAVGLGALSQVLSLEHSFDRKALPEDEMKHLLGIFFDSVLGCKSA